VIHNSCNRWSIETVALLDAIPAFNEALYWHSVTIDSVSSGLE
jgi:hypothetical protein